MPRKQNGFGKSKAFNGVSTRVNKSAKKSAAGTYPSDRRYGSSVHRSVIEKYDLDSTWAKWRRGLEYYYQGSWEKLYERDTDNKIVVDSDGDPVTQEITSKLYQGTPEEMDVKFTSFRYPTKRADTRNHYVVKRANVNPPNLGTISEVLNDPDVDSDNRAYGEVWIQGSFNSALRRMVNERITDGETEATITNVLTANKRPAIYVGKSYPQNTTTLTVSVPLSEVLATTHVINNNNNVQSLVGEIGYLKDFFVEQSLSNEVFSDDAYDFQVSAEHTGSSQEFEILDRTDLPPSLYDIAALPKLYDTTNASFTLNGNYKFLKEQYQRFFGKQYLTGDVVETEVSTVAFSVMPFTINSLLIVGNQVEITSIPFDGTLTLYASNANGYLTIADHSFTKTVLDEYDSVSYHKLGAVGAPSWYRKDTDVDPWMDEVFTSGNQLKPADVYCCSCPDYSKSQIRMPETQGADGAVANRQARYPLPTVMSESDFLALGLNQAAGIVQSWEDRRHRLGFKMCKHTIATMFMDSLKIKEPNSYPTVEVRKAFEEKLEADIKENNAQNIASIERLGITTVELVYALAAGLNLDDIETAYVMLNSNY